MNKDALKKLKSIYGRLPASNATDDLGFLISDLENEQKITIPSVDRDAPKVLVIDPRSESTTWSPEKKLKIIEGT